MRSLKQQAKSRAEAEAFFRDREARFADDAPATNIRYLGSARHPVPKHIWAGRPVSGGDTAPYSGPKEAVVKTRKGGRKIVLAQVVVLPNIRPKRVPGAGHPECMDARRDKSRVCPKCREGLKQSTARYRTTASEWDSKQRDPKAAAFNPAPPAVKFSKSNEVGD